MYVKNIDQRVAMRTKAEYDTMLKIYNRSTFTSHVNQLLEQGTGVFLMLDIDDFKLINDTYGHPYGDQILIKLADTLKVSFPRPAVLGRLGGDEFGIFLPDAGDKQEVRDHLNRLFGSLVKLTAGESTGITVTCSVGISRSKGKKKFKELYQDADEALYRVKYNGKNGFSFYDELTETSPRNSFSPM